MITNVGKRLKQLCKLQGFSQEYSATQLGISIRAYSKIESEETKFTIDRLNEISDVLGISSQELLGFDSNIIFNNSTSHQKDEFIAYNNTAVKQVQALYERLLAAKNEQLEHLRNQLNGTPRKSQ